MNVRKMRQIGKDILAEPRRFNIGHWGRRATDREGLKGAGHAVTAQPPCGTVACFAGEWALRYAKVSPRDLPDMIHDYDFARTGMDLPSACQANLDLPNNDLFYEHYWPEEVAFPEKVKPGTRRYAEHFVNVVLESYIRTNGWQNGKV